MKGLFVIALLIHATVAARPRCARPQKYDYSVLALQWPKSFCRGGQCSAGHTHRDQWLIHGLWPQYKNGSWPRNCCGQRYDESALAPIGAELERLWPSLRGDDHAFWRHEWSKHGTCASVGTQLDYFTRALTVANAHPIGEWLRASGVQPSDERPHSVADIHAAIERHSGHRVRLECTPNRDDPRIPPLLLEVHVCVARDGPPVTTDCLHRDDRQCARNGQTLVLIPN